MPTPITVTDRLDDIASDLSSALTVANTATGISDTNVTDAIDHLVQFYRPNALEWNLATISNASSITTVKQLAEFIVPNASTYHTYMFVLLTPPTSGSYTPKHVYGCSFYKSSATAMTGGGMYYNSGLGGFSTMDTECTANNGDVYGWMEIKENVFPNLRRVYTMSEDGQTLLSISACESGANVTYSGSIPTKPDSQIYEYAFDGWSTKIGGDKKSNALLDVTEDRTVYAHFDATLRPLTVQFRNKSSGTDVLLDTVEVVCGETAEYTGDTPVYGGPLSSDFGFWRWNPSNVNIQGDTVCYAEFDNMTDPLRKYMAGTITKFESDELTVLKQYAFYGQKNLTTVDLHANDAISVQRYAFQGATNINALIIRSSQKATLVDIEAFHQTKMAAYFGAIYVPQDLVTSYQNDSNWCCFRIAPISSYPLSDFSSITDSWSEIFAAEEDGTYATKYHVGDTKIISLSTGSSTVNVHMRIVAMNTDTLATGTGTAKITWISRQLPATRKMNSTAITTGGWAESEMRAFLRGTVLPSLPSEVQNAIKEVTKTTYDYDTTSTVSSTETIWLPSAREIVGTTEDSGPIYSDVYFSLATRRFVQLDGNLAGNEWLRTAYSATQFGFIYGDGRRSNANASNSYGYAFGFCT